MSARITARVVLGLVVLVTTSMFMVGCSEEGPVAAAEEVARSSAFDVANASMAYDGDLIVEKEEISEDGNSATVKLLADDESRSWTVDLEKKDGEWVVVTSRMDILKDITITVP